MKIVQDETINFHIDRGPTYGAPVCPHAFALALEWTDQADPGRCSTQVKTTFAGTIPVVPGDTKHVIFKIVSMECIKRRNIPDEGAAVVLFFWLEPNEFPSDTFPRLKPMDARTEVIPAVREG